MWHQWPTLGLQLSYLAEQFWLVSGAALQPLLPVGHTLGVAAAQEEPGQSHGQTAAAAAAAAQVGPGRQEQTVAAWEQAGAAATVAMPTLLHQMLLALVIRVC
jgi:hypothetical protein